MSTDPSPRRAWVDVDLDHLVDNARTIRAAAGDAALLPMVKANAYGLGVARVVRALERCEPWGFGVATVAEGAELRGLGVDRPVVVFTPARDSDLPELRTHDLEPVIDDPAVLDAWPGVYHGEIDTGMGRAGFRWDDAERLSVLATRPPASVFTHFHSADTSLDSVRQQMQRFRAATAGCGPAVRRHVANSAGAFRVREDFDLVRPGIFLYGGSAGGDLPQPRPVVAVRATVVSRREVMVGDTVSYGADWTARRQTTVATLGIGYADGVPRRAVRGGAQVLVSGRRYPVVGRVTMDMMMADVGSASAVEVGDVATVIGADAGDRIGLDEYAGWAGTISYEILVRLGARLPRVYHGP